MCKKPQTSAAWCSRGEKLHVFKRGKTCSYLIIFDCLHYLCCFFFCSDFLFPIFSQYPMQDSGGARHLRERNHLNSLHIFTLGDMSNPMWYLVLTLYMSSQSWYSCGFFCLLWLAGVSVLSNLVHAGSFHPKTTQDHKVSICITVMCMRNSC